MFKIKQLCLLLFPESKASVDVFTNVFVVETGDVCVTATLIWSCSLNYNFGHESGV